MIAKASYILLTVASLGLLLLEAPHGNLLTRAPERGKVQQNDQLAVTSSANRHNVRAAHFVFIGGFHGGK
ncbi:MAG: hypothetical protein R6X02_05720 [Enhygromyxa sp.]